jgi:hypothetical protein
MSATKQRTWPTLKEADEVAETLGAAMVAVDRFVSRCYGLTEEESPWEIPEDTPIPTLVDVGVLARAATNLREHTVGTEAEQLRNWSEEIEQLLASASSFEARERDDAARRNRREARDAR